MRVRSLSVNRAGVGHLSRLYSSLGPTQYFHLRDFMREDKIRSHADDGPAVGISAVAVDGAVAAAGF